MGNLYRFWFILSMMRSTVKWDDITILHKLILDKKKFTKSFNVSTLKIGFQNNWFTDTNQNQIWVDEIHLTEQDFSALDIYWVSIYIFDSDLVWQMQLIIKCLLI